MFADSPKALLSSGASSRGPQTHLPGQEYLQHQAEVNLTSEEDARATDHSRLLERVAWLPNLAHALLKVASNKGAPGVDGESVESAVEHAPQLLADLHQALMDGTYIPGDIRRVWIPKPGGGERGLGIPNVVDRIVQQAVLHVLEPIFEPTFHNSSHGFRRRRGAQTAIAEAKGYLSEGFGITVDIDLSKFFDRVHHQRLLCRLAQQIGDGRILKLIHRMLKAKVVLPDGTSSRTHEGTPQGGPLSPLLSNVVLDELDWELSRRGLRFVRYADDFSVFVRSRRAGERVMASVQRYIEDRLHLRVNADKSSVSRPFDLSFLGFQLRKKSDGEIAINISAKTKQRLNTRIRELTPRVWGNSFARCVERVNRYLNGWMGYFRLCTHQSTFKHFDAHIRRRLRAILVRQKKRRRHLFRHLQTRGVSRATSWKTAYSIRGLWKQSASPGVHLAYSNAWFAQRLMSLCSRWQELQPAPRVAGQLMLF